MTSDQALKHPFMQLAVDRRDSKYIAAYFESNMRLNSCLLSTARRVSQVFRALALLHFVRASKAQDESRLLDTKADPDSCPSSPTLPKTQHPYSFCRVLDRQNKNQKLYFIRSTRAGHSPKSLNKLASRIMEHTESSNSKLKPNLSATRRALEQKFKSNAVNATVSKFQLKYIGLSKEKIRRESPAKLQTSVESVQRSSTNASLLPDLSPKKEKSAKRRVDLEAPDTSESRGSPNKSLHLPKRNSRSIDFDRQLEHFIKSPVEMRPFKHVKLKKAPPAGLPTLQEPKQIDRSALAESPVKYMRIRRSISQKYF